MSAGEGWICSKCGGGGCHVLEGRPSLDERYAIGWCPHCTPLPTVDPRHPNKTKARGTVILARDTPETRAAIEDRERRKTEAKLVEQAIAGQLPDGDRGDVLRAQATAIRQRWAEEAAARRPDGPGARPEALQLPVPSSSENSSARPVVEHEASS